MSVYSFRTTTNGVLRNYRSNLNKSYSRLNTAMTRVQTQRKNNTYADDPSAASRGFQLRRALWRNNDQIDNTNNAIYKFQTGYSAVATICDGDVDHPGLNGIAASLQIIHDPTGGSRVSLGQELNSEGDSVVQMMNATYNDSFVFAGADGKNVPFTWTSSDTDSKRLLYRGIDVDTPDPALIEEFTEQAEAAEKIGTTVNEEILAGDGVTVIGGRQITYTEDADGNTLITTAEKYYKKDADGNLLSPLEFDDDSLTVETETVLSAENAFEEKYGMSYEQAQKDYATLQKYLGESTYVDIGLGMTEDENGAVPTSAFDTALHGLKFIGYGMDEDGDPKNVVSLMRELAAIANRCDAETGAFASDEDAEDANRLTNKLRASISRVSEAHVELSARSTFLNSNAKLLQVTQANLDEQRSNLEDINPALAITEMTYADYCYSAALKIGNSILSQSLLDYMN